MCRVATALLLLAVLLSGCKVDATVDVSMRSNGSGTVRARIALDADAVRAAEVSGGKLEDRVRLGDLVAAGWTVSPWKRAKDAGAALELSKPFARPQQVASIVRELNGADGPLRDFQASRAAGFTSTKYRVRGVADLQSLATGVKSDADLVARLTAQKVEVDQLDQQLLGQVRDAFHLTVRADLPGGAHRTLLPKPGTRLALELSSSTRHPAKIALLVLGVLLGALALTMLVAGELRRAGPRASQPWPRDPGS